MISKTIYKKIAKDHGVTVAEVKRDMQSAIEYAYKKPDITESEQLLQENIKYQGELPTPEELIAYVVQKLKSTD